MIRQGELDLRSPERAATAPRPPAQTPTRPRPALFLCSLVALAWAGWVTVKLIRPGGERIVAARLSTLVGEYVQAEARSAVPRAQVEAEMRRFMMTLDRELQRRGARGEVVLVGEAVLSRNVPDITNALRRAMGSDGRSAVSAAQRSAALASPGSIAVPRASVEPAPVASPQPADALERR